MTEQATFDVELPNGDIVKGVPEGTTKAQLLDMLSQRGEVTTEDAAAWGTGSPGTSDTPVADDLASRLPPGLVRGGPAATDPATFEGVGTAIAENFDIPGGIGGAMVGAQIGSAAGPWGAIIGTIGGGAAGTFGGEVLSDYFMSEEPDWDEATKNAAISAGVDAVTLGAATKFKSAMKILGFNGDEISQLWKTYTKPKPKAGAGPAALPVGSSESLKQTQGILEGGGGTLRAYQTGQASIAQRASEGLAEVGVVSGPMYQRLDEINATTIANQFQKIADEAVLNPNGLDMGAMVHGVIDGGKTAARQQYNTGLEEVSKLAGKAQVNPKWFVGQIDNFVKSGKRSWGNEYSADAIKLARAWQEQFKRMPSMSVDDMLAFQRKINSQIADMGKFGSTPADQAAARDLAILSEKLRTTTEALLKGTNKQAHNKYIKLNQAYGEAMEGLVPKLNVQVITRANKGDYESIARVLEGKNPDQIEAFLKSIDTAFNNARLAGVDMAETAGVKTAQEAKQVIKQGWMKNIFGDISSDSFDPGHYARLAKEYEKPANQRAAKAILGQDWPQFKALLNAMAESTEKPKGFIGSLVLRSKEAQAAGNVVTAGIAGMTAGIAGLGAVILSPVMLGKIVTRPGAVRALLEGNRQAEAALLARKVGVASEITERTLEEVFQYLTPEEQAEVRQEMRNGG